jgi:hypothetical protein
MNRIALSAAVAALLMVLPVAAQETAAPAAETVFAPFVGRARAAVKDNMVKLTWIDSRDAVGPLQVFRAAAAFSADRIKSAESLGEVPYGAQSFIDTAVPAGTWYYFIAATGVDGTRYDLVIPYGNTTSAVVSAPAAIAGTADAAASPAQAAAAQPAVTAAAAQPTAATAAATPATASAPAAAVAPATAPAKPAAPPAPPPPPAITAISARVQGDAIEVSFAARDPSRNAVLYRSASPIARMQDLLEAVIVASAPAVSPIIDYPVPGIAYYYALISEEALKAGTAALTAGQNATAAPVEVPAGQYRIGLPGPTRETRSMPLPLISIDAFAPVDGGAPAEATAAALSPSAAKAVAELLPTPAALPKTPERNPRAFPQDMEAPTGGEEYALRTIVQGAFAKRDWTVSVDQLARYLSLPRSAAVEARARFYLGQAYYFLGKNREALFEFLLMQSQYPSEAADWLQAILPALAASANF